jgi:hypothetical protein
VHRYDNSVIGIRSLLLGTLAVFGLYSSAAFGQTDPTGYTWPGGNFQFKVNVGTFANLRGLSLPQDQARFWSTYAFSQWKERTGANLAFTYLGDTTVSTCFTQNSTNEVIVQSGCGNPECTLGGLTQTRYTGSSIIEADVCMYANQAFDWGIALPFPTNKADLISVLEHEYGHALGRGHTNNTVMTPVSFRSLGRYPYQIDIDKITQMYGSRSLKVYFSEFNDATGQWPTTASYFNDGYNTRYHPTAAIGLAPSGPKVIIAFVGLDNHIYFRRGAYPLSLNQWDIRYISTSSTSRPPAMAARPDSSNWIMVWADAFTDSTAGGTLHVTRSADAFDNITTYNFPSYHTIHSPAATWDPAMGRFVVMWVDHSNSDNNDLIFAMTSTDGLTWTSAQSFGLATIDGVDLACKGNPAPGICMMTVIRGTGSTIPYSDVYPFTVTASGSLLFGAGGTNQVWLQRTAAAGRANMGAGEYWYGINWSNNPTDWANGRGQLWSAKDSTVPFSTWNWLNVNFVSDHTLAIADSPGGTLTKKYAVWVNP